MPENWTPLDPQTADSVAEPGEWFRGMPVSSRIDLVMKVVPTPPGGWSVADLADLAGCTKAAILHRQRTALRRLRETCLSRGITPRTIRTKDS
jgi:hypothetical protein